MSDAPDREAMIDAVTDWRLAGLRRSGIAAIAKQEGWTVTADDLADLIAESERRIIEDAQAELPGAGLAEAIAIGQLRDVFALSMRSGDPAGAMAARKELNRVSGLTGKAPPPARFSVTALPTLDAAQAELIKMLEEGDHATNAIKAIESSTSTAATSGPAGAVPPDSGGRRRRKVPASRRDPE